MKDGDQKDGGTLTWWVGVRLAFGAIVVVSLLYYGAHPQQLSKTENDWLYLAVGICLALFLIADVRAGATGLTGPTFERSKDPLGFWVFTSVMAGLAVALIVGTLGGIFGLWKF